MHGLEPRPPALRELSRAETLALAAALLAYFAQKLLIAWVGLNWEEARIALLYLRMREGLLPYRDAAWIYGPLAPFVYGAAFWVFGATIPVLRVTAIVLGGFGVIGAFLLARVLMPPLWAGVAAVFAMLLFHTPGHTYNHILATVTSLFSLYAVARYLYGRGRGALIAAGLFTAVSLLVKPLPMGAANFLAIVGFLCLSPTARERGRWRAPGIYTAAALLPTVVVYGLFAALAGPAKLLDIMLLFPTFMPPGRGAGVYPNPLNILALLRPATYQSVSDFYYALVLAFNTFVSYVPAVFPLAALWLGHDPRLSREQRALLRLCAVFSPLFAIQLLLTGGDARTGHLGDGYTYSVPLFLLIYAAYRVVGSYIEARPRWVTAIGTMAAAVFLLVFFLLPYALEARYVVRPAKVRDDLALWPYTRLTLPRASGVAALHGDVLEQLVRFLQERTRPDEPIVVMNYNPMLYFLADRKSLFPEDDYIFLRAGLANWVPWPVRSDVSAAILTRLEARRPRYIVIQSQDHDPGKATSSPVHAYVAANYHLVRTFDPGGSGSIAFRVYALDSL